jgi:hypothetical protein
MIEGIIDHQGSAHANPFTILPVFKYPKFILYLFAIGQFYCAAVKTNKAITIP